ncbi:amino acid permease [Priestia aryabhattai]|uniref:amino acid permease n=1 Tax=Priestia aryabhattai TaxID=412384 RepID=UPI00064FA2AD|nr:amino acid permease [Priestia aryabhattai]KML31724.1 transporter [Priestia aryabhattai]KMN94901.1 transporter [Priestia aryabhattai]MED3951285.1 amino acid permease [Priestia aryabhattai]
MKKKIGCGSQVEGKLKWWQLSLIGVGCIIGTGYFLGSSIAIKATGPSVLIAFLLAAVCTFIVFDALAKMSAQDPQKGSFRSYAKKAYGRWAGFSSGWVYWSSEMLIMGSQLTALSLFTRFWFDGIPLWVFASIYAVLGIAVVLIGTKGFERMENVFAVTKVAAILMFIVLASLALFGFLDEGAKQGVPRTISEVFPHGFLGLWGALLYAFYAFGGIEVMGIMTVRLEKKEDAPKAGRSMLILLGIIYIVSLSLAILIVPFHDFHGNQSPFIKALETYHLPFFPHVFNGAMIIAGFSTMSASFFSVTTMIVTLSEDGDAPALFSKQKQKKLQFPLPALLLTTAGLIVSIVLSLLLPGKIYEYITTAAGLMLIYNWFFILISFHRLIKQTVWDKVKQAVGLLLILLAVSGTLLESASRPGFFASLCFLIVISLVILKLRHKWKEEEAAS